MEGFFPNLIKYLLFATNFLVLLISTIVLGIAIYALSAGSQFYEVLEESTSDGVADSAVFSNAGIIALAIVAAITVIVTFFGCCGAIKENACMLGTYFVIILILFISLVVAAVVGYNKKFDTVPKPLKETMKKYKQGSKTMKAWDKIQKDFSCCGVEDWTEWQSVKDSETGISFNTSASKVPDSCCKGFVPDEDLTTCREEPGSITKPSKLKGCYTKFKDGVDGNKNAILGISITVLLIMFMNMIFAFVLCTMVK